MRRLWNTFRQSDLAAGIGILAVTQFLASGAGLVRNSVLNEVYGDRLGVVDAYIAAFRPSDLIFQACIMSAMGTVLVPILASYYAKHDHAEMRRVLHGTTHVAACIFGLIALLLGIFFPYLAPYLTQFTGEELALYVSFARMALFVNFLFVFGNAYGQYLITVRRYWIYGWTPVFYTCGTIAGTLFLRDVAGDYAPMAGTIAGGVLYVALRFIAVARAEGGFDLHFWHPEIPGMALLMLPRILSLGAFQVQLLFLDRLASGFSEGSIVLNSNGQNFASVVVGVVGIAIAQSVYSLMSQAIAKNDNRLFYRIYGKGTRICTVLTILGGVVLVVCSPIAARLVHLTSQQALFTKVLAVYALSIPFESLSHLQLRAFYALRNTATPALWGVVAGIAAIASATSLAPTFGILSVGIGYAVGEIVQATGLHFSLPRHLKRAFAENPGGLKA